MPRSKAADIELALDAAHAARDTWGRTRPPSAPTSCSSIADRMEENLEYLAVAETWENGKPVRETLAADLPLAIDHFRYYAGAIRAQEGTLTQLTRHLGRVPLPRAARRRRPDHPVELPHADGHLEAGARRWPPATASCSSRPSRPRPRSCCGAELIGDLLPDGVLNIVNGFGVEAGKPLASSNRIAKIAFTGETTTGRLIMQYASQNLIPVTLELGGKSPNIFMADVMDADDAFLDKALEGFAMFALNQGEVCTCPSRALIQESIYDDFIDPRAGAGRRRSSRATRSTRATMIGAQASTDQLEKILSYLQIGREEGAKVLIGGDPAGRRGPRGRLLRAADGLRGQELACGSSRRRSSARSWP